MTSDPKKVPISLMSSWRHFETLHQKVVLLTAHTENIPFVREARRLKVSENPLGFYEVGLSFGYREVHDVPLALRKAKDRLGFNPDQCLYLLGRTPTRLAKDSDWSGWRAALFLFLSRNAANMREFFRLPSSRTVELGLVAELD